MTVSRRRTAALALSAALLSLVAVSAPAQADYQPPTWHFNQARVYPAEAAGNYGSGVVVAVIDTWVDGTHPSFEGRVVTGADCVGGCRAGNAGRDGCADHGTHVAGTIASSDYGVAPAARILPLRVLVYKDGECTASSTDVAAAIDYAISKRARVINLSLAGQVPVVGQSSDITNAVNRAASAGIVVVFAAGNDAYPVADTYGGNALIVAATNNRGQIAPYSQRGSGIDVAAPGGDASGGQCAYETCVVAPVPDGEYGAMAGTSMAAPHVSGLAALLIGQNPSRSRTDVMNRIRNTARPLANAGSGLIDASAALGVNSTPKPTQPAPQPTTAKPKPPTTKPATAPTTARPPLASTSPLPSTVPSPMPSVSLSPSPADSPSPSDAPTEAVSVPEQIPPLGLTTEALPERTLPAVVAGGLIACVLLGLATVRRRTLF